MIEKKFSAYASDGMIGSEGALSVKCSSKDAAKKVELFLAQFKNDKADRYDLICSLSPSDSGAVKVSGYSSILENIRTIPGVVRVDFSSL